MNKKTLIFTLCSLTILSLIIVVLCFSCGEKSEKETIGSNTNKFLKEEMDETNQTETGDVDNESKETYVSVITENETEMAEAEVETTTPMNEMESSHYPNDEVGTEAEYATEEIQATEEIEATTTNIVAVETEPVTTQVVTTVTQPTTVKEEATTAEPVPVVESGWKPEMVTEFYTYFKPYINKESEISADLKSRYDTICSNYLNLSFGCDSMITALEAEWEICTCDACVRTGVYDFTYRFSFSEDSCCGAEIITVEGYGSEAVSKIVSLKNKAVACYAYVNIYYDSTTNTSTAYICTRGSISEAY